MSRTVRFAAAVLALVTAGACSDDLGAGGDNSGGDFTITVGSGAQPQYTWPGGPALSVSVFRASNTTIPVWEVVDAVNRDIASPLRHGTVPAGAQQTVPPSDLEGSLTLGVRYRVEIRLASNQSAFQEFTP